MLPRRGAWHECRSYVLKKISIAETPREEIQRHYILQVGDSLGFEGLYIYDRATEVNHQTQDWYNKSFTEYCPVQRVANYGSYVSRGNTVTRKEELLQLKNCFSFSV